MELKVTLGDIHGYGFVYFNDDTRVGYAVNTPCPAEDAYGPYNVFASNWGGNTDEHKKLADAWLRLNCVEAPANGS